MHSSTLPAWTPLTPPTKSTSMYKSAANAGPSSQLNPAATAPSSASAPRIPRKRLPPEAYDILTYYYCNVNTHPKKKERLDLAERIRRIPGCEDYSQEKVNNYFAGKRAANKDRLAAARRAAQATSHPHMAEMPPAATPSQGMTSAHILYPSLMKDSMTLHLLEVLLNDHTEPTIEVAAIWADKIGQGVKAKDILTYARLRQAQRGHLPAAPVISELPRLQPFHTTGRLVTSQLPTPASSTSPEPHSLPASPVVESSWGNSVTVSVPVKEEQDELEDEDEEMDVEEPEADYASAISCHSRLRDELATRLQMALYGSPATEKQEQNERIPRTFTELSRWIGEQDNASTPLLGGVTKGAYIRLGLKTHLTAGHLNS